MFSWLIQYAHAADAVINAKAINVCNSFFNFIHVLPCTEDKENNPSDLNSSVAGLIINFINFLLTIAASVAMVVIVYAGLQILAAAAEPEREKEAKKLLGQAIYGLVIVMTAFILTTSVRYLITKLFA